MGNEGMFKGVAAKKCLTTRGLNECNVLTEFSTRFSITIHTKSKLLTSLVHGTIPQGCVYGQTPFSGFGTSPGPPARLTLQCQATSSGGMLKAKFTKHLPPISMT